MGLRTVAEGMLRAINEEDISLERPKYHEIPPNTSEKSGEITQTPQELILENRETTNKKMLGGGINVTEFVDFLDDGSGVFKPRSGESQARKNIEVGTYFKRERAAYLVDKFLDFGIVPPTVIREINGEIGSVQTFIPDATLGCAMDTENIPNLNDQLTKLWIFDCLIFNTDRHDKNFLEAEGKIYAIDNGLAFGYDYIRTYDSFFGKPVPQEIVEKISSLFNNKDSQRVLKDLLLELLPPEDVTAFFSRLDKITNIIQNSDNIPWEQKNDLYQYK